MHDSAAPQPLNPFFAACEFALAVIGSDEVAIQWEQPSALEGLSVGALAADLYAAIRVFEAALASPEPSATRVVGLSDFYALNRVADPSELQDSFHVQIREEAAKRSAQGPAALTEKFSAMVERLRGVLPCQPMNRLVPVRRIDGGSAELFDYLLTRVVELVVHTDDLAASVGVEIGPPTDAATASFMVFVELARSRFGDTAVLRAFTRQERGDPEVLRVL